MSSTINALDGIEAADAPFFLHVPLLEPHPPYFTSPPYDKLVDSDTLDVPDQRGDGRPEWQAMAREQMGSDSE